MKRAVLVLLILSLCLALCACGEPQVIEKEVEVEKIVEVIPDEYEQFRDIVDALVREDYDSAQALIEAMKPEPEKPPIVEVSITTENFFDYFEYVHQPSFSVYEKADSGGTISSITIYPAFVLKEGFSLAEENLNDCSVKAGVKYPVKVYHSRNFTVDLANHSFTATGKPNTIEWSDSLVEGRIRETGNGDHSYYIGIIGGGLAYLLSANLCQIIEEGDVELVSASGTLYLYE